jgi:asparagine synthase (glutamine-hydrolysing)
MCGILGWYAPGGPLPDERVFNRALTTMRHRGPDDSGLYWSGPAVFGHVRLSVIDPSHGRQPWTDAETGVTLVYNGELYNARDEKRFLTAKGHCFRGDCDTEVLLRLYLEYGPDMLGRLSGMFAFAIHDPRDLTLFCARDHMGIKPFYFQTRGGVFTFASEVKALVALGGDFEPDPRALADYISLQYVMGEKTFFKGVSRLLPGQAMLISPGGGVRLWRYFDLEPEPTFTGGFEEAAVRLRELLDQSITSQLRSDVPLGAHLSGGVDTGSICALAAARLSPTPMHTFTAAFTEGGVFDDTAAARLSAAKAGTIHHEMFPSAADFAALYPGLVWHLDEPMAAQGVFPQYIVSRLAREHVTVVLGGQGADEIFGGYTRYYILLLEQAIRYGALGVQEKIGISIEELARSLGQLRNYGPLLKQFRAGPPFEEPEAAYWRMIDRAGPFRTALTPEFIVSLEGYDPYDTYRQYLGYHPQAPLLSRVLLFETNCWLPALLHVEDRMSMAVSLESRVPLLDPEIVRFAFSLPPAIAMKNGRTKAVMRTAFARDLPSEIADRQDKLGFPVPTGRWFAGELKDWLASILNSPEALGRGIFKPEAVASALQQGDGDFGRALWGMLNLELWHGNLKPCQGATDS